MKIEELHIYGYGKLENLVISNLGGFQVFYGENEAGKSTIMSFIHGILFGFPTKQQQELRYEPKGGGRYGGKLALRHPDYGLVVVERVKGKAAGDVTVFLEDGSSGGEELLKLLLGNFDKSLYQAVFSFNLHGLQNVHQMKDEDIGRFLFSAGTLGTDRLAKAESELQKELEARFKPSGKKPALNAKLASLRALETEVGKAAEKNTLYGELTKERDAIINEIRSLGEEIPVLAGEADKLKEWERIEGIAREEAALADELGRVEKENFPARGIERLETCKQMLTPYSLQIEGIKERMELLQKEVESTILHKELLENEAEAGALAELVPVYDQSRRECAQLEERLSQLEERIGMAKGKLHLGIDEEEIAAINTDIYLEQQAEEADERRKRAAALKVQLEADFQEEKIGLEQAEKELKDARAQLLPKDKRSQFEKLAQAGNKDIVRGQLEACKERIVILEEAEKREEAYRSRSRMSGLAMTIGGLVLAIYGFMAADWLLLGVGLIFACIAALVIGKGIIPSKSAKPSAELDRQKAKAKQLEEELLSIRPGNVEAAASQLEQDDIQRLKVNSLMARVEQQTVQYEKVLARFDHLEKEEALLREQVDLLSRELRISSTIGKHMPAEAFRIMEECKNAILEKKRIEAKIRLLKEGQAEIEARVERLGRLFPETAGKDIHLVAHTARTALEEEKKKAILLEEKSRKLEEMEFDLAKLEKEQAIHEQAIQELFAQAGVENEEEYHAAAELAMALEEKQARLNKLRTELSFSMLGKGEIEALLPIRNASGLLQEANGKIEAAKQEIDRLQERLAKVRYEIQVLEEGGTYSELLHSFRMAKSEFEEEAKEWAVYKVASELLRRTTGRFKEYHLPRLLKRAGDYLGFLTGGAYRRLFLAPSGTGFLIERSDNTRFEANELSQATTEQVYVSLRLALAETIYEKFSFPFIIDDSFVNFDGERTARMIELLKGLDGRQVLFFTCHPHLLGHFGGSHVHHLARSQVKVRG
ncbi:ATP-binding protein [Bacillus sp. FJAT-27245]|uniref:ATP-binding protein n=1 Tax=Bacillus sp. FJAT-27245 TaxID=1684144 RepID=UPI0006A7A367|nr:AAA family ATPase [Bacillus sp. FJAT-27245]